MSNPHEQLFNSLHFIKILNMLKDEGKYVWTDTGFVYTRRGTKATCNKRAYAAMTAVTGGFLKSVLQSLDKDEDEPVTEPVNEPVTE